MSKLGPNAPRRARHLQILTVPPAPLPLRFYRSDDVWGVARALIGCTLWARQPQGHWRSARIVETEAYAGATDRASHAYGGRRTARTEVMFGAGGVAYVYLCYGMHHLLNVVTGPAELPHAVLIRAGELLEGFDELAALTPRQRYARGAGPGRLTRALGVATATHNGLDLRGAQLCISAGPRVAEADIVASPRIGVDYAGPHAALPWRYHLRGSPWVSRGG